MVRGRGQHYRIIVRYTIRLLPLWWVRARDKTQCYWSSSCPVRSFSAGLSLSLALSRTFSGVWPAISVHVGHMWDTHSEPLSVSHYKMTADRRWLTHSLSYREENGLHAILKLFSMASSYPSFSPTRKSRFQPPRLSPPPPRRPPLLKGPSIGEGKRNRKRKIGLLLDSLGGRSLEGRSHSCCC